MNEQTPSGLIGFYRCPACGSPMVKKGTYGGGTATQWAIRPVSSTGSAKQFLYPEQDEYECSNPGCRQTLLRPSDT
jgi:hypothetical protein